VDRHAARGDLDEQALELALACERGKPEIFAHLHASGLGPLAQQERPRDRSDLGPAQALVEQPLMDRPRCLLNARLESILARRDHAQAAQAARDIERIVLISREGVRELEAGQASPAERLLARVGQARIVIAEVVEDLQLASLVEPFDHDPPARVRVGGVEPCDELVDFVGIAAARLLRGAAEQRDQDPIDARISDRHLRLRRCGG